MAEFDCLGELSHSRAEIQLVGFQAVKHPISYTHNRY